MAIKNIEKSGIIEEKNYKVYCWTCSVNNKKYIGITKQTMNRRARNEGKGYKHCVKFYNAITKYGFENFSYIIIEDNLSFQEAKEKEIYYINKYKTNDRRFGYNLSSGGDAPPIDEEWISKMKKRIVETIGREVVCFDKRGQLVQIFESISEASRVTGAKICNIYQCCKKFNKSGEQTISAKGYLFCYIEDYEESMVVYYKDKNYNRKPVVQLTKDFIPIAVFNSVKEAMRTLNNKGIIECVEGYYQFSAGCRWAFLENYKLEHPDFDESKYIKPNNVYN